MSSKSKSSVGVRGAKSSKAMGRNAATGESLSVEKVLARPVATIVEKVKVPTRRKNDVFQIRASAETKAVLVRAANLRGQGLSEFMLDSARREAEDAILDQRVFFLDSKAHAEFIAMLDNPAKPSDSVRARMRRKPSWER